MSDEVVVNRLIIPPGEAEKFVSQAGLTSTDKAVRIVRTTTERGNIHQVFYFQDGSALSSSATAATCCFPLIGFSRRPNLRTGGPLAAADLRQVPSRTAFRSYVSTSRFPPLRLSPPLRLCVSLLPPPRLCPIATLR